MFYIPKNLLGKSNAKTTKGEKLGWISFIMYMSPYTQNDKGVNVCPMASAGCIVACLFTAGRGKFSNVEKARINKSNYFIKDRKAFLSQIKVELAKLQKKALNGVNIAVRLNGTSDISWEKFINMSDYPNLVFYDYTKNHLRFNRVLPANYNLLFSRSETNEIEAFKLLDKGVNVAVVFATKELPKTYKGYPVVDGDETDLRFLDDKGVIVGLYAKGDAKKDKTGFVVK